LGVYFEQGRPGAFWQEHWQIDRKKKLGKTHCGQHVRNGRASTRS
jgi:hypothetical protein